MRSDIPGGGPPDARIVRGAELGQHAGESGRAMGLPHDVGVERDAEHHGAAVAFRQQLLDRGADHAGERLRLLPASDDRGDVVDLLRIGDRQQPAVRGRQPRRLVVVRPVEDVAIALLRQQVRRPVAFGNPGAEPPRRADAQPGKPLGNVADHRHFAPAGQVALRRGVRRAMRCNLVATVAARLGQARAGIEHVRVDQRRGAQVEPVEQIEQPPRADAIAVITPGIVHDVGIGLRRGQLGTQAAAELEHLVIDAQIDGEAATIGPVVDGTIGDRAIGVAVVVRAHPPVTRRGRLGPKSSVVAWAGTSARVARCSDRSLQEVRRGHG